MAASTSTLLTKPEAADALRVSLRKLDYIISSGELATVRIGGSVRISRQEIKSFIAAKTEKRSPQISAGALATA